MKEKINLKYSKEFLEGFNSQKPRITNPYAVGQPWLSEHPDKHILARMKDWDAGWECRFYGEEP